jgi:hypothetical protein
MGVPCLFATTQAHNAGEVERKLSNLMALFAQSPSLRRGRRTRKRGLGEPAHNRAHKSVAVGADAAAIKVLHEVIATRVRGAAENENVPSPAPSAFRAITANPFVFVRPGRLRNRCDTCRSIAGFVPRFVAPRRDHRVVQPQ